MKTIFTLGLCLLFLGSGAQDLSGIWRGSFVSAEDAKMSDLFNMSDRYKYEVQIDQHGKSFTGVTYSYKTTVFYGKASSNGTINPKTGKVILQELKLLELKMSPMSYACWMICFLQYSKNGDEEFLEGRYSSYRETDSAFCGKGTVFLRKAVTSDFYPEPFLSKHNKEKKDSITAPAPVTTGPPVAKITRKDTLTTKPATAKRTTVSKPHKDSTAVARTTTTRKPTTTTSRPPATNAASAKKPEPVATTGKDLKGVPLVGEADNSTRKTENRMKDPIVVPPVLKNRENELVRTISVTSPEVIINIYDNGTIDHDTISVYLDNKLIVSHQMLTTNPITVKLKMDDTGNDYHELIMVAENLGDIPPNTSLMVVKAGDKQQEVRITSTEQKNAMVIFKYEKPK